MLYFIQVLDYTFFEIHTTLNFAHLPHYKSLYVTFNTKHIILTIMLYKQPKFPSDISLSPNSLVVIVIKQSQGQNHFSIVLFSLFSMCHSHAPNHITLKRGKGQSNGLLKLLQEIYKYTIVIHAI